MGSLSNALLPIPPASQISKAHHDSRWEIAPGFFQDHVSSQDMTGDQRAMILPVFFSRKKCLKSHAFNCPSSDAAAQTKTNLTLPSQSPPPPTLAIAICATQPDRSHVESCCPLPAPLSPALQHPPQLWPLSLSFGAPQVQWQPVDHLLLPVCLVSNSQTRCPTLGRANQPTPQHTTGRGPSLTEGRPGMGALRERRESAHSSRADPTAFPALCVISTWVVFLPLL